MPTIQEVIHDPDFQGLPDVEKKKVLQKVDADFKGLPDVEQNKAIISLSQIKEKQSISTQKGEQKTPEWAGRHPNIYGVYGAAKETIFPIAEGLSLAAGDVAKIVHPAVGAGLGGLAYGAVKGAERGVEQLAGEREPMTITEELKQQGKDIITGAAIGATGQVVGAGLKAGAGLIPKRTEQRLIESAMKPSTTLKEKAREEITETVLREKTLIASGGLKKANLNIKNINQEIDDVITKGAEKTVSRDNVITKLQQLRNTYVSEKALPKEALKEIDDVIEQFQTHPSKIGVEQAQEFKKSIYRELSDYYKKFTHIGQVKPHEWNEARATLASGLREELNNVFPELVMLNKRDASLIQLQTHLERAVNRISNQNLLKLIASIFGVGGSDLSLKRYLGALIADHPAVKSITAMAIRQARLAPMKNPEVLTKMVGVLKQRQEQPQPEQQELPSLDTFWSE